jgi:hypothetical protein
MAQKSFYAAESFDLAQTTVTYTAAGLGSAKYTAGVAYYTRLDLASGMNGPKNNFVSVLWSKGSGTAGTAYLGLYYTDGTKLYQLGASANIGSVATGIIRQAITLITPQAWPLGELYLGLLVATDSGTNHVDVATSTPYAANPQNADPTGGGGLPRAFYGAGTALTAMPLTETLSGVTASGLLAYAAID